MTPFRIAWRSLFHEAQLSFALVLAMALGVAVLLGAFTAGDTLKAALRRHAQEALGCTELALVRSSGTFREQLVDDLAADTGHQAAPVLRLRGVVTTDRGMRLPGAWIVGVDNRFGRLGDATPFNTSFTRDALLNRAAAERLGVHSGDEIVIRVARPESLPGEAALAGGVAASVGTRVRVGGIVEDSQLGRFALEAQAISPDNVFLPLPVLQALVGTQGRANVALLSTRLAVVGNAESPEADVSHSARRLSLARGALQRCRQLDDLGLEFRALSGNRGCELRSRTYWIDPEVAQTALGLDSHASAAATYLVKAIRYGTNVSPYAFMAGGDGPGMPWPSDSNAIVLNDWLSADLGATTGDTVTVVYDQLGVGRALSETSRTFRVARIIPVSQIDRGLMPELPGIGDATDCRDWKGGVLVDTRWIRPQDQAYWAAYRGTPRALVSLAAAREMWSTRWGVLTAVRFESEAGSSRELTVRLLAQLPE
ncbi:MAG: ABC transporter permease, partial [Kiritimatiellia bacterium]